MKEKDITVDKLQKLNACPEQVARFKIWFPNGANVTRNNCLKAQRLGLELFWVADHFFGYDVFNQYRQDLEDALYTCGNNTRRLDRTNALVFYQAYRRNRC